MFIYTVEPLAAAPWELASIIKAEVCVIRLGFYLQYDTDIGSTLIAGRLIGVGRDRWPLNRGSAVF